MSYPVTDAFRAALLADHTVSVLAQVIDEDNNVLATLNVIGGVVTVDAERLVRREAGDITVTNQNLTPLQANDLLSPLNGYEIKLFRGIKYADGTAERVPLGVFGYTSVTLEDNGGGLTVTLGGLVDRSERVSRARYSGRVLITNGTSVEAAVTALVTSAWPDVPLNTFPTTGKTMPAVAYGVEGDGDPWSDAVSIAEDKGYRLYFDQDGKLTMSAQVLTVPDTGVVNYGTTQLMVTSLAKTWDTADTYNGVIAVGEGSGLLIIPRATVWDDVPTSPTYYLGGFGKRPRIYSSPLLLTVADATEAATVQLNKSKGLGEQLRWSQIVDPSLDVDDAVGIVNADMSVNAVYLLSRISVPLSAMEPMTAEARVRRLT